MTVSHHSVDALLLGLCGQDPCQGDIALAAGTRLLNEEDDLEDAANGENAG